MMALPNNDAIWRRCILRETDGNGVVQTRAVGDNGWRAMVPIQGTDRYNKVPSAHNGNMDALLTTAKQDFLRRVQDGYNHQLSASVAWGGAIGPQTYYHAVAAAGAGLMPSYLWRTGDCGMIRQLNPGRNVAAQRNGALAANAGWIIESGFTNFTPEYLGLSFQMKPFTLDANRAIFRGEVMQCFKTMLSGDRPASIATVASCMFADLGNGYWIAGLRPRNISVGTGRIVVPATLVNLQFDARDLSLARLG
jgi:hypothetical protein